jgi:MATH domain
MAVSGPRGSDDALACADTLHRFCKKEHDWGWKKFMELNKVLDGFTVDNQLVIKAQVQVRTRLLAATDRSPGSADVLRPTPLQSYVSVQGCAPSASCVCCLSDL